MSKWNLLRVAVTLTLIVGWVATTATETASELPIPELVKATEPTSAPSATKPNIAQQTAKNPTQSHAVSTVAISRTKAKWYFYGRVSIPEAKVRNRKIQRYFGSPGDKTGEAIDNLPAVSSPHGKWGGVDVGQVGSFFLEAHRTSAGGPFLGVPDLKKGQRIYITRRGVRYTYAVAYRIKTNYRSKASLKRHLAPVPGRLGTKATRPAIILETCATPEDNGAGLRWRDAQGNPTHRWGIVGFLIATKPVE